MNLSRYFDHAAATPVSDTVLAAMEPFWQEQFYNPSALYQAARHTRHSLESIRGSVAQAIGCRPSEIVFTSGGTESNNMAIYGVLHNVEGANVVTSAIEHDSVLVSASRFDVRQAPVSQKGVVDVQAFLANIDDHTRLVSIMLVNNEVGSIQPLRDIVAIINDVRKDRRKRGVKTPIYVHTDACQAANYIDIQINRLGVDLLTLNGGKMYGPKQSGILYVRAGTMLTPLLAGGGQEWGLRSGTEHVALAAGFATALADAQQSAYSESRRLAVLRDRVIDRLQNAGAVINGTTAHKRIANNIHVTFPGYDNERLLMELDERGFQVAVGSACSASSDEPSHVLRAMGIADADAQSSLRITLGRATTQESVDSLVDTLLNLVVKH